ncbi:hypothetical protein BTVI_70910 [Pitangus sulphuratus]|nr:hypothetical protein BTVI_70910 [Pitangus sulphuratus]
MEPHEGPWLVPGILENAGAVFLAAQRHHARLSGGISISVMAVRVSHGKGKKSKEVDIKSKFSRDITSPQEEECVGTGCSSLGAWTRMLQDEDGHRTKPCDSLFRALVSQARRDTSRLLHQVLSSTSESRRGARDMKLCRRSSRDNAERAATGQGEDVQAFLLDSGI